MEHLDLLLKLLQSPFTTLDDLCKVITRDHALTQKILNLVNTRYYATGGIRDLQMALMYIGSGTLLQLILNLKLRVL